MLKKIIISFLYRNNVC